MNNEYNYELLNDEFLAFKENYRNNYTENWHSHPYAQLIHTTSGVIRVQTAEGVWISPPGRGVLIPANKLHSLKINGDLQVYGIFIKYKIHSPMINECKVVNISNLLKELIPHAVKIKNTIIPNSRDERLVQLILDELEKLHSIPINLPEPKSTKLKSLCNRVKENLDQNWHVEYAAELLHVSPRTLSRAFKKETNMYFSHWVRQARIVQAIIDLTTRKSILNIALDLGYQNTSAFGSMFKRETGLSPKEYIQHNLESS